MTCRDSLLDSGYLQTKDVLISLILAVKAPETLGTRTAPTPYRTGAAPAVCGGWWRN